MARTKTILALAEAFGVDPRVLTGELPIPDDLFPPAELPRRKQPKRQLNMRVTVEAFDKVTAAAEKAGKPVTRYIEDWIMSLPS